MNCTPVPGGTCAAGYKSLKSYSDFLTPAESAPCVNVINIGKTNGWPDPNACLEYTQQFSVPSYCCSFQDVYVLTNTLPLYDPQPNAGSLCFNPNFASVSCVVEFDQNYPFNSLYPTPFYIACPNAGIMNALTASIPAPNANTSGWGQGLSLEQAFNVVGPYGCYDATPLQNQNLFDITHQFCPLLDQGISYTNNVTYEWTPSSWTSLSLTVACCARASQTLLTGDSAEQCDGQACFQSPQCGELLRDFCSQTANRDNVYCTRWKAWTTGGMLGVAVNQCTSDAYEAADYPLVGTHPSSMDQAMFSVLDYCSANSLTDPDVCGALSFAPGLNNTLLFPRMDGVVLSDIVPQFSGTPSIQTVTFSITNVSPLLLRSITVLKADPANLFTVSFQTGTLYPTSKTLVTVTTTQTQAMAEEVYILGSTTSWVADSFNADDMCENVGTFFATGTSTSPTVLDYPLVPSCAPGDTEMSFQLTDAGTTTTSFPPVFDSMTCASIGANHTASMGSTPFPSCSCTSPYGCSGGLEGGCESSTIITRQLASSRVCSTQGWSTMPIFFIDSVTWLPTLTAKFRQDFPIFGGFQAGYNPNPFASFLTATLQVFPLTSNEYLQ